MLHNFESRLSSPGQRRSWGGHWVGISCVSNITVWAQPGSKKPGNDGFGAKPGFFIRVFSYLPFQSFLISCPEIFKVYWFSSETLKSGQKSSCVDVYGKCPRSLCDSIGPKENLLNFEKYVCLIGKLHCKITALASRNPVEWFRIRSKLYCIVWSSVTNSSLEESLWIWVFQKHIIKSWKSWRMKLKCEMYLKSYQNISLF